MSSHGNGGFTMGYLNRHIAAPAPRRVFKNKFANPLSFPGLELCNGLRKIIVRPAASLTTSRICWVYFLFYDGCVYDAVRDIPYCPLRPLFTHHHVCSSLRHSCWSFLNKNSIILPILLTLVFKYENLILRRSLLFNYWSCNNNNNFL